MDWLSIIQGISGLAATILGTIYSGKMVSTRYVALPGSTVMQKNRIWLQNRTGYWYWFIVTASITLIVGGVKEYEDNIEKQKWLARLKTEIKTERKKSRKELEEYNMKVLTALAEYNLQIETSTNSINDTLNKLRITNILLGSKLDSSGKKPNPFITGRIPNPISVNKISKDSITIVVNISNYGASEAININAKTFLVVLEQNKIKIFENLGRVMDEDLPVNAGYDLVGLLTHPTFEINEEGRYFVVLGNYTNSSKDYRGEIKLCYAYDLYSNKWQIDNREKNKIYKILENYLNTPH